MSCVFLCGRRHWKFTASPHKAGSIQWHFKPSLLRSQLWADVTWGLQEMHILPAQLGLPNGPRDVCSVKRCKSRISRQDKAAKVQMWNFRHLCNTLEVCFLLILLLHLTNYNQSPFSIGFDCEIKKLFKRLPMHELVSFLSAASRSVLLLQLLESRSHFFQDGSSYQRKVSGVWI